jgi:inosose dehydratase
MVELGPYGYMPADPSRLGDELEQRKLDMVAGTMEARLHDAPWETIRSDADRVCGLVASLGARFLVVLPPLYTDVDSFQVVESPQLDDNAWRSLVANANRLGAYVRDEFGLVAAYHPHADSHLETAEQVDRFLEDTDPESVALCLDTGHYEYRDGNSAELVERVPERIPYLHLKSVDPAVLGRVESERLSFAQAVRLNVMCEPTEGKVDFEALKTAIDRTGIAGHAVVEHDMYPLADHNRPLPIAARTLEYFVGLGWHS